MTLRTVLQYAVTQSPTPVFNTLHISKCFGGEDGNTLDLDEKGLMRSVETILFPQSKIELLERVAQSSVWKIRSNEYSYGGDYYIDDRFIRFATGTPPDRAKSVPPLPKIISKLESLVGTRYIWGGNWPSGIDELPRLFPSRASLEEMDPLIQDTWKLKGVDCTGLLHYVTNGWTKRNSSSLINFGRAVPIEGLSLEKILDKVQSLDMIAWEGHIVCILGQNTSIESKYPEGVIKLDLAKRLSEIMRDRKAVNNWNQSQGPRFVIRRWHPDRGNCKTSVKKMIFRGPMGSCFF